MIKKIGEWVMAKLFFGTMTEEMKKANEIALKQIGLYAERKAIGHIQNQDLNWPKLSKRYKDLKERQGHSEKIYIRTSTYFNAITSWVEKDKAYAGIKKGTKASNGQDLVMVQKVLEYGSKARNIPPRPLWKPVFKATKEWIQKQRVLQKSVEKTLLSKFGNFKSKSIQNKV